MRIDPSRIGSIQSYQKQQQVQDVKKQAQDKQDQVKISSAAQEMLESAKNTAGNEPVREEKVEHLKTEIESGRYRVDSREVANKFLEFWRTR